MVAPRPRKKRQAGKPEWLWRRLIIIPVLVFICWQLIGLKSAPDTRVNDTLAFGYLIALVATVLLYAGLATVQDIAAILATRSALPYAPESSPADQPDYETGDLPAREPTPEERLRGGA